MVRAKEDRVALKGFHAVSPSPQPVKDVEREVKAVRDLHAAEQARARKASEVRRLELQLGQVQQQKLSVQSTQRDTAAMNLGMLLNTLRHRVLCAHSRWALHKLNDACKMLIRKQWIVTSARNASVLSAFALAWRAVAACAIADRQAANHMKEIQRVRKQASLAEAHYARRLACHSWLAWQLEINHAHTERSKQAVAARATAFLAALPACSAQSNEGCADAGLDIIGHAEMSQDDSVADTASARVDGKEVKDHEPGPTFQVQDSAVQQRRPGSRSKELRAIAERVQERKKSQEERRQRQKVPDEQGLANCMDTHTGRRLRSHSRGVEASRRASAEPPVTIEHPETDGAAVDIGNGATSLPQLNNVEQPALPSLVRPRALLEMERRAEERRRVHELRRQRQKEKQQERQQKQAEEEEQLRIAEEEAKQERLRLRKEQAQEQRRLRAQRLVAAAIRRDRERQAVELHRLHQYIRVWCALRQEVSHAAFWELMALNRRRTTLLKQCVTSWHHHYVHSVVAKSAARLARAHLAISWLGRRFAFRTLVMWLKRLQMAKLRQYWAGVDTSRRWCLCLWLRRWAQASAELSLQKKLSAVQQHAQCLIRRCFCWWQTGLRQLRIENAMESHKKALRDRVSGWLQEMGDDGSESLRSLHPNFSLMNLQKNMARGYSVASAQDFY